MTSPWASSKGEARAGDLLGLRALDGDGVAVNARGELVRVLEVSTKNPATLSVEQTVQVAEGFGALVNTLDGGQSLCFYVEATPVLVDELLARDRAQSSATVAALRQTPGGAQRAEAIERLGGAHEQSITRHAGREVARHVALRRRPLRQCADQRPASAKASKRDATRCGRAWRGVTRVAQAHRARASRAAGSGPRGAGT
jgi:hypothetical protein